jgi:hypothetical protein
VVGSPGPLREIGDHYFGRGSGGYSLYALSSYQRGFRLNLPLRVLVVMSFLGLRSRESPYCNRNEDPGARIEPVS